MQKCCFIGHRDAYGIDDQVRQAIKNLIELGVTEFYSGGMGNFDELCERTVKELGGRLVGVLYDVKQAHTRFASRYDDMICPYVSIYNTYSIPRRNKWMVNQVDVCLCWVKEAGGAKKTLDYAIKKKKTIINLAQEE